MSEKVNRSYSGKRIYIINYVFCNCWLEHILFYIVFDLSSGVNYKSYTIRHFWVFFLPKYVLIKKEVII